MKSALKILAFATLAVITMLVLAASWISFQGRREFAAVRSELLAHGEKLSLAELVPPPIPDAQNFFADPLWQASAADVQDTNLSVTLQQRPSAAEVRDLKTQFPALAELDYSHARELVARDAWKKAPGADAARFTEAILRPLDPTLARVATLLGRPGARFPVAYEKSFAAALPHISPLLTLGRIFQARAQASLALGDGAAAQSDILLVFRLANTIATEPLLISVLVRATIDGLSLAPLATGLSSHTWTDPEILALQRTIEEIDLPAALARAIRGERCGFNEFFERLRRNDEAALIVWVEFNGNNDAWNEIPPWRRTLLRATTGGYMAIFGPGEQAFHNRHVGKIIDALDHAGTQGLRSDRLPAETAPEPGFPASLAHTLITTTFPALTAAISKVAETQDRLIQARIACALERFFLRHHEYPAMLEQLVPEFLPNVPADIVTMSPMHYQRTGPDAFRLWSDGWDLKNNDGVPADRRTKLGDWVWNEPSGVRR